MTIVKIKHKGALNKNQQHQSIRSFKLVVSDADDDFDGSYISESGCELVMIGDKICNIPYDLYDLSNLKDVLSIETWNSCLTEEERFDLAAYMPEMDHETFLFTLKELLSGDNLYFGSPLENLFNRMKSGFYSLQVTPVRESLRFFQKRRHYLSLKLYHDNMNQKFSDMRKAWSNCVPNAAVEEKIQIWKKRNNPKPLLLVDLNAMPADDESLDSPLPKKIKSIDEGITPTNCVLDLNKKAKGKGVLTAKPVELNLISKLNDQTLPSECGDTRKRTPKGLLKIKPKSNPFGQLERPIAIPIQQFLQHSEDDNKKSAENCIDFPVRYKRKNSARAKLIPIVGNVDSLVSSSTECKQIGKPKAVRLKFKGWNNNQNAK